VKSWEITHHVACNLPLEKGEFQVINTISNISAVGFEVTRIISKGKTSGIFDYTTVAAANVLQVNCLLFKYLQRPAAAF
jgi:hypothetical protein